MKLNMLLNSSVMAACLFANVVDTANAMEPIEAQDHKSIITITERDPWAEPITQEMIEEGLKTYQKSHYPMIF